MTGRIYPSALRGTLERPINNEDKRSVGEIDMKKGSTKDMTLFNKLSKLNAQIINVKIIFETIKMKI